MKNQCFPIGQGKWEKLGKKGVKRIRQTCRFDKLYENINLGILRTAQMY